MTQRVRPLVVLAVRLSLADVIRLGLAVVTMIVFVPASGARAQAPAPQESLPKAPGKDTVELVCGACHEVDTAIGTRRTSADWRLMIDAMINRGAMATEPEFKEIFDYLSKYFGLVNVNKAAAPEIATVLELPVAAAEAIVRHRTEHGEFTTVGEVMQVPGVDAKAIEERKLRIAFK